MAIAWTIKGEAGKAVDATARTLPQMKATGAVVRFGSLGNDSLRWSVAMKDLEEGFSLVPELGQRITLYRNGARYFTGWVTMADPLITASSRVINVVVEGPWWWLSNQALSNELPDQEGEESERTAFVFATGNTTDHLQGLTTRAIEMGAPIQAGSIATCFDIPRLSLRNIHFAESYAQLMRWVPDGIVYLDYTTPDDEWPALSMQRRGTADAVTLDPTNGCVPVIRIKPRLDLKLQQVVVASATRATVGFHRITKWVTQTAGTPNPAFPGRQIITTSGPELDTYLPQDFTDSVVVRSAAISGNHEDIILAKEDRVRASGVEVTDFFSGAYSDEAFTMPSVTKVTDKDGNELPEGYDYWLVSGEAKDWWAKQIPAIDYIEARLTTTIYSLHTENMPLPGPSYTPPVPPWYEITGGQVVSYFLNSPARARWVWYNTMSVPFIAVKNSWPTDTTIIRDEDYAFVHPPADLAANLLAAQNWLPYEGQIETAVDPDEIPAGHLVGAKLNLLNVLPAHETMGAMISGQTIELRTGKITYDLGAPARLTYRDMVSQFRQQGADNIVWLSETNPLSPPDGPGVPSSSRTLTESGDVEVTEAGETTVDEDDT